MPVIANVTYGSDFAEREDNYNGKVVTYHKDAEKHKWAALVFLNKPEECEGGTKFYEFKDDTPMWEPSEKDAYTIEMKYNRMILYEADHCHGAILNRDMFKAKTFITMFNVDAISTTITTIIIAACIIHFIMAISGTCIVDCQRSMICMLQILLLNSYH